MTIYQYSLTYPDHLTPISVDRLMRKLLIPRKWRHFLRSEKKILINGKYLPLNFLVKPGDKIEIQLDHIESDQQPYPASGKLPKVVYEDNDILVINKPAGQKTHPNLNEEDTNHGQSKGNGSEPQFVVVFHAVKKGETLEKIATHYQVTIEQVKEWNDLSSKLKPTAQLAVGTQLMIYQPK